MTERCDERLCAVCACDDAYAMQAGVPGNASREKSLADSEKQHARLSIVVPVYNGAPYIQNCLENLEKQTFRDWQAIFVNDGSTDDTKETLERIVTPHARCHVIHKANGGTAQTRNAGLEIVDSPYVTFMDVDDELDPRMYEILVDLMDRTEADMGVCGYYFKVERDDAEPYLEEKNYPGCILRGRDAIREKLVELWDRDMLYNVWNKIYRMDLIRKKGIQYRDGHIYTEDRVFNRAYLENCGSIALTDQCLYYYVRERTGSTSEKYREDYFDIRHKEYIEFQTHFKAMDVWDECAREYVSREFIERTAGCIENIFHAENKLSGKEKRARITQIIAHPDVMEAGKHARCRSRMMGILTFPIKMRWTWLTCVLYQAVYLVRKSNPSLFHKLKSKR